MRDEGHRSTDREVGEPHVREDLCDVDGQRRSTALSSASISERLLDAPQRYDRTQRECFRQSAQWIAESAEEKRTGGDVLGLFGARQVEHLASKDLSLVLRGCAQDSPLVVIDGEVCDITGGPICAVDYAYEPTEAILSFSIWRNHNRPGDPMSHDDPLTAAYVSGTPRKASSGFLGSGVGEVELVA
jgi:hypothetical protein